MSLQERCEWIVYIAYSMRTEDIQNGLANKIIVEMETRKAARWGLKAEWRIRGACNEEERKTYGGDLPFEVKGRSW